MLRQQTHYRRRNKESFRGITKRRGPMRVALAFFLTFAIMFQTVAGSITVFAAEAGGTSFEAFFTGITVTINGIEQDLLNGPADADFGEVTGDEASASIRYDFSFEAGQLSAGVPYAFPIPAEFGNAIPEDGITLTDMENTVLGVVTADGEDASIQFNSAIEADTAGSISGYFYVNGTIRRDSGSEGEESDKEVHFVVLGHDITATIKFVPEKSVFSMEKAFQSATLEEDGKLLLDWQVLVSASDGQIPAGFTVTDHLGEHGEDFKVSLPIAVLDGSEPVPQEQYELSETEDGQGFTLTFPEGYSLAGGAGLVLSYTSRSTQSFADILQAVGGAANDLYTVTNEAAATGLEAVTADVAFRLNLFQKIAGAVDSSKQTIDYNLVINTGVKQEGQKAEYAPILLSLPITITDTFETARLEMLGLVIGGDTYGLNEPVQIDGSGLPNPDGAYTAEWKTIGTDGRNTVCTIQISSESENALSSRLTIPVRMKYIGDPTSYYVNKASMETSGHSGSFTGSAQVNNPGNMTISLTKEGRYDRLTKLIGWLIKFNNKSVLHDPVIEDVFQEGLTLHGDVVVWKDGVKSTIKEKALVSGSEPYYQYDEETRKLEIHLGSLNDGTGKELTLLVKTDPAKLQDMLAAADGQPHTSEALLQQLAAYHNMATLVGTGKTAEADVNAGAANMVTKSGAWKDNKLTWTISVNRFRQTVANPVITDTPSFLDDWTKYLKVDSIQIYANQAGVSEGEDRIGMSQWNNDTSPANGGDTFKFSADQWAQLLEGGKVNGLQLGRAEGAGAFSLVYDFSNLTANRLKELGRTENGTFYLNQAATLKICMSLTDAGVQYLSMHVAGVNAVNTVSLNTGDSFTSETVLLTPDATTIPVKKDGVLDKGTASINWTVTLNENKNVKLNGTDVEGMEISDYFINDNLMLIPSSVGLYRVTDGTEVPVEGFEESYVHSSEKDGHDGFTINLTPFAKADVGSLGWNETYVLKYATKLIQQSGVLADSAQVAKNSLSWTSGGGAAQTEQNLTFKFGECGGSISVTQIGKLRIMKTDASTGRPLEGATFRLDGDGKSYEQTTGKDGYAYFIGLKLNTDYTLTETVSPQGYQLAEASADLRLTADGNLQLKNSGPLFRLDEENGRVVLVVTNQRAAEQTYLLQIHKVDTDGALIPLPALFSLTDEGSGEELARGTAVNGVLTLSGLRAGHTYLLKELNAPTGYLLSSEAFYVTVNGDGSLQFSGDQMDFIPSDEDASLVTVTNRKETVPPSGGVTPDPTEPNEPGPGPSDEDVIPDENIPLTNLPFTPTVDSALPPQADELEEILDEDVPLSNPSQPGGLIIIDDEAVPLGATPQTGGQTGKTAGSGILLTLAGSALAGLALLKKKKGK